MFVFITYLWLLPLFTYLPKAVCSSIIVVAALKLIELDELFFIARLQAWTDMMLLSITFFSTIFISVETGTLISVGLSLLLVVKHTTTVLFLLIQTRLVLLGEYSYLDPEAGVTPKYKPLKEGANVRRIKGIMIVRFEEGLFFGNCGQLQEKLKRIEVHGDLGIHPGEDPLENPDWQESVFYSLGVPHNSISPYDERWGEEIGDINQPIIDWIDSNELAKPKHSIYGVIFDMKAVSHIDASATVTIQEIVTDYQVRNIKVCFVKLRSECLENFKRAGIYDLVGQEFFFSKIKDAVPCMVSHVNIMERSNSVVLIESPRAFPLNISRSSSPEFQNGNTITSFDALRSDV
jgi:MFS superfamily sulfate permease-like transporter